MTASLTDTVPASHPDAAFVAYLHTLAKLANDGIGDSRAKLARLRRTLTGRDLSFDGLKEVGHVLPPDLNDRQLDTCLLVAALFAMNTRASRNEQIGSLGASLRTLRLRVSAGAESLDQRVTALLNANFEDLPYRLRQVMQQIAAKDVPVNYYRLLRDLLRWDHPNRFVQRQWSRDYWIG